MQILSKGDSGTGVITANRKTIRKCSMKNIVTAAQDIQPFNEQCTELGFED